MTRTWNVAIVGATGAVGATLLRLMDARAFPLARLYLLASAKSAGRTIRFRSKTYPVAALEDFDFHDVDLAFFSAGTSVSREHARRAAAAGSLVIDNTNAFRMLEDCPLVVPQVNGEILAHRPGSNIIANPNCSTIPIVRVIHAIHAEYPVKRFIASTYQAASGAGLSGIEELKDDTRRCAEGLASVARRFPVPLGFNVIPFIDSPLDNGFTLEEQKMLQESRKILGRADLLVSATTVRVPVVNGHSAAVYFECERPIEPAQIRHLLESAPEMTVYSGARYPTPRFLSDPDRVHVGRIRRDVCDERAGWFWVVSDNLRIGAALNAIQIAERLLKYEDCPA